MPDPVIEVPRLRKGSVIAANEVPQCRFASRIKKVQANPRLHHGAVARVRAAQSITTLASNRAIANISAGHQ